MTRSFVYRPAEGAGTRLVGLLIAASRRLRLGGKRRGGKRKVALAAMLLLTVSPAAHAGLFDWLCPRPAPVAVPVAPVVTVPVAQTNCAPACTVARPVCAPACATAACAPTVAYAPTTVAYAPAACPTGACGTPVQVGHPVVAQQQVVVGYAPTYRTNWVRVPVTYYRPVTSYNASGYPFTGAVPCNTYSWQAQRVPTVTYRPWLPFAPTTYGYVAPAATVNYAAAPAIVSAPAAAPCAGCAVPATSMPLTTNAPTLGSSLIPGAMPSDSDTVPATATSPANGVNPADQAPSLIPGNFPSTPPAPPAGGSMTVPSNPATGSMTVPSNSGAVGTGVAEPASTRGNSSPYRVTPIPAPDLRTFESQRGAPQAPPLLPGRERTVFNSAAQSTSVVTASWETPKATAPAAKKPASPNLWNDSGWKSER